MATIEIKNIGPIRYAKFDLNRVNVFMGPQSSGKSTIAKICSQCCWFEKNYMLTGKAYEFYSGLIKFHRMDKNYFTAESELIYKSAWLKLHCKGEELTTSIKKYSPKKWIYKNLKIEYIPAERNFVAAIPNLQKYSESYDNIINFLNDWLQFKKNLTNKQQYISPLLSVDINYGYNAATDEDILTLHDGKKIHLQNASSGQQSVTPLLVVCEYLFNELYTLPRIPSFAEQEYIQKLLSDNPQYAEYKDNYFMWSSLREFSERTGKKNLAATYDEQKKRIEEQIGFTTEYDHSNIIIEEPEQNLFPETQKELVYHLLRSIQSPKSRKHTLLLTTHSPYILYALNNCMMGGLVNKQLANSEAKKEFLSNGFLSEKSWIAPQFVSIWEIDNGTIRGIQDKDHIIAENYFDQQMTEITDEYYQILNYYQDEE